MPITNHDDDDVTDVTDYLKRHRAFRQCRKFGHAFTPTHDNYYREAGSGLLYQRLRCLRGCGLPAVDTWHPKTMDRVGQRSIDYSAQPEYLAHGTRVTRIDVRMWERSNVKVVDEPRSRRQAKP